MIIIIRKERFITREDIRKLKTNNLPLNTQYADDITTDYSPMITKQDGSLGTPLTNY